MNKFLGAGLMMMGKEGRGRGCVEELVQLVRGKRDRSRARRGGGNGSPGIYDRQ
jgi:hypothetical protein